MILLIKFSFLYILIYFIEVEASIQASAQINDLQICNDVFQPSEYVQGSSNCSIQCSLRFQQIVSTIRLGEIGLCIKDRRTPLTCTSDNDCRTYLRGSYCKKAYCLCQSESGMREYYVFWSETPDVYMNICVAQSRWQGVHIPAVTFPWRTLLIAFATLVTIGLAMMALKWLTPLLQVWREDRRRHNVDRNELHLPEETIRPFRTNTERPQYCGCPIHQYPVSCLPSQTMLPHGLMPVPHDFTTDHCTHCSHCRFILSDDKPPAYEAVAYDIEPPPSYTEAESQPLNGACSSSANITVVPNTSNPTSQNTEAKVPTANNESQ